jgi:hypothetical protein
MDYDAALEQKLASMFESEASKNAARLVLAAYGEVASEREISRVRLAILDLSGPDLSVIKRYTQKAKQDYRDLLYWADHAE